MQHSVVGGLEDDGRGSVLYDDRFRIDDVAEQGIALSVGGAFEAAVATHVVDQIGVKSGGGGREFDAAG